MLLRGQRSSCGAVLGGCSERVTHAKVEGTALALVTEGTRVACPTETLRGLWGHVASGVGGQSQGEGVVVTEPLPVPGLSPGCRVALRVLAELPRAPLPSAFFFSLKFLNYIIYWKTVRSK